MDENALEQTREAGGAMHQLFARPGARVAEIQQASDEELQLMLVEWNRTQVDYSRQSLLHELIEVQVSRSPKSPAVQFKNRSFTYEELNSRANQLAVYLRGLGVGPDVLVGVCLERSLEMVVALLAVLKAGGAYVPLDPSYPKNRLSFMLADSGLKIVVTQASLEGMLTDDSVQLVRMDLDWNRISLEGAKDFCSGANAENLAYVIYTSGSTGKPKGVQIPHRALVNFVEAMTSRPGLSERDSLLAVTTISFDIAALELYVPLVVGARIVIADRQTAMDGRSLAQQLTSEQITIMQATPITWHLLLESGWEGKHDLKILIGGEALTKDLASRLLTRAASLWNMYGPTETTVWSTLARVEPDQGAILIGKPIANTTTYILDQNLRPVAIGGVGELYIGGDGLARGYLNRPELTQERFIDSPFREGARIYRTGDLARYDRSGAIECLGRADNQVKIRGFRIELGEIESSLTSHHEIRQAAVIAQEDVQGNKRLVAYIVPHAATRVNLEDLEQFLRNKLPSHMVPSHYFSLEELPLTPNGKVDRKALPVLSSTSRPTRTQFSEPHTSLEVRMAAIWAEVLCLERVGVTENFFDIGNSLLAARLFTKIAKTFGVELSLNSLLNSPTVSLLAARLESSTDKRPRHQLVPIQPLGRKKALFWIPGGRAISVLGFRETALHLDVDRPVYGLESRLPEVGEQFETVQRRAAEYLKLIREVQPRGPYHFAGFCTGGMVAYEMAQQLSAQGEHVALLALVQAALPGYPETPFQRRRMKLQRVRYLTSSFGLFFGTRLAARFLSVSRETQQDIHTRVAKLMLGWIGTSSQLADQTQVDADSVSARYVPSIYTGDADLFLAEDCFESAGIVPALDPRFGWRRCVSGNLNVHRIPGDHYTMLTGLNAKQFASALESRMAARND
jgi:amino acid adenylation domain-containing protein